MKDRGEYMEKQDNRIVDSVKDTSEQAIIEWENEYIRTNVPRVLDWMTEKIKETVLLISNDEKKKMSEQIKNIIFQGIEMGEKNKEIAVIKAMKNAKMDDMTIQKIISNSNKYLVTRDDYDENVK